MRPKFIEGTERAGTDGIYKTQKGKERERERERESYLCLGPGNFFEDCGLVYMSSLASGNWLEQTQGHRCLALAVLNMHVMTSSGHSGHSTWSFLRCYPLCCRTPKKSLAPCPLQGGRTLFAL